VASERDQVTSKLPNETVEPVGPRVLVRRDESRQQTRGGVVLPDKMNIPVITGRVVAVSAEVKANESFPIRRYDKILFDPRNSIPVDFEGDNRLHVIPVEDVVAVFRRQKDEDNESE
jgi:chaperonin GroES